MHCAVEIINTANRRRKRISVIHARVIINHMYMCKQVLHTILMVPLTLCAEPELKIRIIKLRSPTDLASVPRRVRAGSQSTASPRKSEPALIAASAGLAVVCMIGASLSVSHTMYVLGELPSSRFHLTIVITSPLHVLRRVMLEVPRAEEENKEVHHRCDKRNDRNPIINISLQYKPEILTALVDHKSEVKNAEPLYLDWDNKVKIHS